MNKITFGILTESGLTNTRMISQSNIAKCPFCIMVADHYREDGTCKCNDPEYRKMMMKEWGYKMKDFIRVGLIKK